MDRSTPVRETLPFRDDVRAFLDRARAHDGPVLSLYLDVHAEDDPKAPAQRTDAALRELPLERADRERLENRITGLLREVSEGYLVLFSALDPDALFEYRLFRPSLPLPGGERDAFAHFGDPLTAPAELLLASERPVLAVYLDERHARVFLVDAGDVQETTSHVRALNSEEWRNYVHKSRDGDPTTNASRGGSGRDQFQARAEAWTTRFVKDLAQQLAEQASAHEGTRLVLLGEPERTAQLHEHLPMHLKDGTLASAGTAVADPDQPDTIWARPLQNRVAELKLQEQEELIERFVRNGGSTLAETLDNLQKGLLSMVAVPVEQDVEVLRCLENGWLATSEEDLADICGDGPIERVALKEHLAAVVRQAGAELVLMRGPAGERVQEEFGGLAGLPRR